MRPEIISHIIIRNNRVWINNVELEINVVAHDFMKSIYKFSGIKYPKFYKMDALAKLGFIASEVLLRHEKSRSVLKDIDGNKVGIVFQNSDATVDVDTAFYKLISDTENYHPSPALFVYTLPNISIGEIAIYNKFRGENALFVSERYNIELGVNYINSLLNKNKIDACLGGWFNANDDNYEAFIYLVTKSDVLHVSDEHVKENIIKTYKNNYGKFKVKTKRTNY